MMIGAVGAVRRNGFFALHMSGCRVGPLRHRERVTHDYIAPVKHVCSSLHGSF
jgi:hypothetical protein